VVFDVNEALFSFEGDRREQDPGAESPSRTPRRARNPAR
jgi:hypothetical protein